MDKNHESEAEKLMRETLKFAEETSTGKGSNVSVGENPKLIGYENKVKQQTDKKEVSSEIKAKFDIERLIDTCGFEKIEDRINQLEELFYKYPKLKEEAETMTNELLEEARDIRVKEIYNKARKDKYSDRVAALEEIIEIFF